MTRRGGTSCAQSPKDRERGGTGESQRPADVQFPQASDGSTGSSLVRAPDDKGSSGLLAAPAGLLRGTPDHSSSSGRRSSRQFPGRCSRDFGRGWADASSQTDVSLLQRVDAYWHSCLLCLLSITIIDKSRTSRYVGDGLQRDRLIVQGRVGGRVLHPG